MQFFEEEGVVPTEATPSPSRGAEIFEPVGPETVVTESAPTEPTSVTPSTTPATVDVKAFAEAFGEVIARNTSKPTEPEAPKMTDEEAKKLLKVWEPTKEWEERFDNLETRGAAIKEMRDGQIAQADVLTQVRVNQAIEALRAEYTPAVAYMTEQAAIKREEKFSSKYEPLAKPELRPLLSAITQDFQKKGKTFETEDELFEAIASTAESIIKVHNPTFSLSAGSNPAVVKTKSTSKASVNAIPVTTGGASGGGGGGQQIATAKPRGLAIFD